MPTVSIFAPELSGTAGMFVFLRAADDGALLNSGGDALTESPASSGRFTATVAESIIEIHHAVVHENSTESAATALRDGWIESGGTLIVDAYPDVAGVLEDGSYPEVLSPPSISASILSKIQWIFQWHRNKAEQDEDERRLYADDGTTVISTEAVTKTPTLYRKGEQV
jgi:hypothetical protein